VANHVDGKITLIFNSAWGGIYNQSDGGGESNPRNGYGDCTEVYCHAGSAQTWGSSTPLVCDSCHGASSALPGRHSTHYANTLAATDRTGGNESISDQYIYNCGVCHPAMTHARGEVISGELTADVVFNSSIAGTGATNTGGGSSWADDMFNWTDATCSTYCHSDGTSLSSPFTPNDNDFNWATGEFGFGCESCHSSNAAATNTMDSGRHLAHMNSTIEHGDNFECDTCHADTVDSGNDAFIADKSNHVDTINTVVFNSVLLAINSNASFTQGADTCSNVYCHSDGADLTSYWSINWDDPVLDCKGCHGTVGGSTLGEPAYQNTGAGLANANSHKTHVEDGGFACKVCHLDTTDTNTHTLANGIHLDGVKNVVIWSPYDTNGGATSNYNGSGVGDKNCSAISCHGGGSPQWGGSLAC
ncbi:hypothetical protein LCGC14_2770540, partial [marine sediment metagenome]